MRFGSGPRRRSTAAPRLSLLAALLVAVTLAFGSVPAALAQDATPEAGLTGECNAPEVPEGTPEPMPEMASPEAMDMATPEASPMASPAAEAMPTPPMGEVVEDQAVIDEATAAITGIYACLNEANYLGAAALFTEDLRLSTFGTGNLYTVAAFVEEFAAGTASFEVLSVDEVQELEDGRLAVDNSVLQGQQVFRYLDVLVEEDGFWKLDESYDLMPETDLNSVTVGLQAATDESEYAFAISPAEVPAQPAVFIRLFNVGEMDHEAVIFRTPEDFDPATLVEAAEDPEAEMPEGVEFVGFGFAPVGGEAVLLFQDLEPGTYTIYCFLPAPDGESHAAKGQITQLTITEPVEEEVPDITGGTPEATPET